MTGGEGAPLRRRRSLSGRRSLVRSRPSSRAANDAHAPARLIVRTRRCQIRLDRGTAGRLWCVQRRPPASGGGRRSPAWRGQTPEQSSPPTPALIYRPQAAQSFLARLRSKTVFPSRTPAGSASPAARATAARRGGTDPWGTPGPSGLSSPRSCCWCCPPAAASLWPPAPAAAAPASGAPGPPGGPGR